MINIGYIVFLAVVGWLVLLAVKSADPPPFCERPTTLSDVIAAITVIILLSFLVVALTLKAGLACLSALF